MTEYPMARRGVLRSVNLLAGAHKTTHLAGRFGQSIVSVDDHLQYRVRTTSEGESGLGRTDLVGFNGC